MDSISRLTLLSLVGFFLAACAAADGSGPGSGADAGPVTSGSPDAGTFVFPVNAGGDAGAGPLLTPCSPGNASSCVNAFGPALSDAGFSGDAGIACFSDHTSASWWVDLYGTCTFDCNGQTAALCASLDGVCGCPVDPSGTPEDCSLDGGASMVCVPAVKPGTAPGSNEGDGGCGTPGCGGGPPLGDAGTGLPVDAAAE